jgi:hypothetical protein
MADVGSRRNRIDPGEPRDPYAAEGRQAPPETAGEALARARKHGRAAAAETVAAVRALIDAASLGASGRPSEASRLLGPLAKLLEGLEGELGSADVDGSSRVLDAVAAAIDDEIALWEERAQNDTDARTILRALLGLREILWEFGVGRGGAPDGPPAEAAQQSPPPPRRRAGRPRGPRIQRVPVQG